MNTPLFLSSPLPFHHSIRTWAPPPGTQRLKRPPRHLPTTSFPQHKPLQCAQQASFPVLAPTQVPSEGAVSNPVVHQYFTDDGPHYVMWYTARPPNWPYASRAPPGTLSGVVSLALSHDGLSWRRVPGPRSDASLLGPNDEHWWAFDTAHIAAGSVLLTAPARVRADAGVYLLYYTGGGSEGLRLGGDGRVVQGGRTCIGVAISKDGENFSRIEGEFPSGAVLEAAEEEGETAFDGAFVAAPCVLVDDDAKAPERYVMFYHGAARTLVDGRPSFAVGRAISADGFAFRRSSQTAVVSAGANAPEGATWAVCGVCRPCVVRRKGEWVMFAEVVGGDGLHRIAMCQSEDGIDWGPLSVVLDVGEKGAWDAAGVSHPCAVVIDGGGVMVYYTGRREDHDVDAGRGTCVGVAESDGDDWTCLRRVDGGVSWSGKG